ncbi:hypothetical protein [Brucella inopinata]|uniref:Uncharacterized protein n=1 Tax=Brucella inopinata TaxID=1218315 RepID=A0AAW7B1X1_9HYPH|nr:hypothetical protein [Brucella inopinata]MDL2333115.1 hypothetical protein [Brucella inopinata]
MAILQVQKKSKAFALPIEYAFDPFSILLAAAETAPGSILPRLDRVKPTVLFRCCSYDEKNSEPHSFCHQKSFIAS